MGRKPIYSSEEERVNALREYQRRYRKENKERIMEQGKARRAKKRDEYSVNINIHDAEIMIDTRFELIRGYYDNYKKAAIAYHLKSLIGNQYIVDAESVKMLCKHGYVLSTKFEERTNSITKVGGFEKIKLLSGDKIDAVHITNTDLLDLSCSKYELVQAKIGRYNKIKRLVYRYKGEEIELSIKELHQKMQNRVLNVYTMQYVKVIDENMEIDSGIGEKYKGRQCVICSEHNGKKRYKLVVNKNTDCDVLVDALRSKEGCSVIFDYSLSDVNVSGERIERTEEMKRLDNILVNMDNREVKVRHDAEIEILAMVYNTNKSKLQFMMARTKGAETETKDGKGTRDEDIYVMDTSVCTSNLYRSADFDNCIQLVTDIDWLITSKVYEPDIKEYTFKCEIDDSKKEMALKDLRGTSI